MTSESSLTTWVSDKVITLLGYSQPMVVQHIIEEAKQVTSPADVLRKLEEFGFPSSSASTAFAQQLFSMVSREASADGKHKKPFGMRNGLEKDDEDGEQMSHVKGRVKKPTSIQNGDTGLESEEERLLLDQKEEEDLERKIRERDTAASSNLTMEPKLGTKQDDISNLRKFSRQDYLKKREKKKLEELSDDIEDEEYLFDGVKLSEVEHTKIKYKKDIYEIVKRRSNDQDDNMGEYRMPESYDHEGLVDQKKRFNAALQRYRDVDERNLFGEGENWEDHQFGKARFKVGSKNVKQSTEDQYVFEIPMEDVKESVMGDDGKFVDESSTESSTFKAKSKLMNLKEERKNLPIYSYKVDLLDAIGNNQVLIIVGETGSGKTTQIPQYLHEAGYTRSGKIGCTQPRRVAAMSVAARVSQEMGIKLGHEVGYSIRFEDCTSEKTVLKYMTDGLLLRELLGEPDLASYSVIMLDEAHERTVSTDILFGLLKDIARFGKDIKLLISSATLDAEKFSDFFDSAPIFRIPGRQYPVEIHFTEAPEANYMDAAVVTILQIHVSQPSGDILVFLAGQDEIETVEELLKGTIRDCGTRIAELIICPIYASLPRELQAKVFEPTPEGARKVVLATNIAETSLTIDGIKYVIDPGFCKMKSYDPRTEMESLLVTPISKASANQRAGRSGRTGPGKCFRLYTAYNYETELDDNIQPEIQRTNLGSVVLTLKRLGIQDLLNFDFMDPPPVEALLNTLELLFALGALNKLGELTKVGRQMAELPLDPMLSKMIVASDKYKCSDEIITIAAMLSVGNSIFYRPKDKQVYADKAKMSFYNGNGSDHIALLNVYNSWKETNYSREWCYENFIQFRSMKRARDIKDQLGGLLKRAEIEVTSSPNNLEAIRKAITSGFFPHLARLQKTYGLEGLEKCNGSYQTVKHPQTVYTHPSSGLAQRLPKWVIYHELVLTAKEYMRYVTEVKPEWLVEIAPHYYQMKDVEDSKSLTVLPKRQGFTNYNL